MATSSQSRLTEEDRSRLQNVIKGFLSSSGRDILYETRTQKLVFLGEVYCVLWYRRRLTQAEYRPYMYGAFSRDVRTVLNSMDGINRQKTVVHGDRTVAYSAGEEQSDFGTDDVAKIIRCICKYSQSQSTEELAQFSKDSWLFESTDYNHPMKFAEFAQALDNNSDIEEQLKERLPSEVEDADDSLLSISGYTDDNR